ncbi:Zinc finger BED domain-containing protein DAYSLEEPER [Bienertia sinuspersici]
METDSSQTLGDRPELELDHDSNEAQVLEKAPKTWTKKKRLGKKPKAKNKGGKRKKTSNAWDHFIVIPEDENLAKCVYCGTEISYSARNRTNAMNRHTDRCKKSLFFKDKTQTILDFESRIKINIDGSVETVNVPKLWRFNHDAIRKALAKMLILDELPFTFVEHKGFCQFYKVAILEFVPPLTFYHYEGLLWFVY